MTVKNPLVFLLLIVSIVIAGCVDSGGPRSDDGEEGGENGAQDEGLSEKELREMPCDERNKPRALPHEQRVDDVDEIECPGHYTVVENGGAPSTNVTGWNEGDWWHWEITHQGPCIGQVRWDIEGETERHNTSLYEISVQSHDCTGQPTEDEPRTSLFTQESLSLMLRGSRDGFIRHGYVFPLADLKEWVYMDIPTGNVVEVEVHHVSEFELGDDILEVWRVDHEGMDLQTGEEWSAHYWFSPEVGNKVQEKWYRNGIIQQSWTLLDSSGGHGEDVGVGLPLSLS